MAAIAVALFAVSSTGVATAQEEDPTPVPGAQLVIFDDTAGPYALKVIQVPERAVVGTLRVVVEPVYTATGVPSFWYSVLR